MAEYFISLNVYHNDTFCASFAHGNIPARYPVVPGMEMSLPAMPPGCGLVIKLTRVCLVLPQDSLGEEVFDISAKTQWRAPAFRDDATFTAGVVRVFVNEMCSLGWELDELGPEWAEFYPDEAVEYED